MLRTFLFLRKFKLNIERSKISLTMKIIAGSPPKYDTSRELSVSENNNNNNAYDARYQLSILLFS